MCRRYDEGVENESVEQIAFADRILLNKIDLVTDDEVATLTAKIKTINSRAKIIPSEQSKVDVDEILGIRAFDLDQVVEMDEEFLNVDGGVVNSHTHARTHARTHTHLPVSNPTVYGYLPSPT